MNRSCSAGRAMAPGPQDPEDAIEDAAVIHSRHAAQFIEQHRLDGSPFVIGKFVAHDSVPRSGIKSRSSVRLNGTPNDSDMVASIVEGIAVPKASKVKLESP